VWLETDFRTHGELLAIAYCLLHSICLIRIGSDAHPTRIHVETSSAKGIVVCVHVVKGHTVSGVQSLHGQPLRAAVPTEGGCVDSRVGLALQRRENLLSLQGIEPWFLGCADKMYKARSLVFEAVLKAAGNYFPQKSELWGSLSLLDRASSW